MNLPKPEREYSYDNEVEARRQLEAADGDNMKTGADIVLQPGQRLILTSPGNIQYAVTVDDAGVLGTTPA